MSHIEKSGEKESMKNYTKRAGPLLLGPQLCTSPVKCIAHCLARKNGTEEFSTVKILTLSESPQKETTDDIQGKILIHTEYSLLKLLTGEKGIVQQHGLYKDLAEEEIEIGGKSFLTGRMQTRICLVLDCYTPHDYCPKYTNLVNLQQYVIKEKRLQESLAIKIFYNVVQIVERLHKRNIVHRDLKLGNIVINKDTTEVTLTNFGLGKDLSSENEMLRDQRGSPAYISPDVISGKPYLGKPSDMWALGVVLYTMLYGQFPFYDSSPTELFRKIKLAKFQIPSEHVISIGTIKLIKSLLVLDPSERLTASDVVGECRRIIAREQSLLVDSNLQVVPDFSVESDDVDRPYKRSYRTKNYPETSFADIEAMLAELAKPICPLEDNDEDDNVHEPPTKVARTAPSLGGLTAISVIDEGDRDLTRSDLRSVVNTKTIPVKSVLDAAQASAEIKPSAPCNDSSSNKFSSGVTNVRKTSAAQNKANGTRVSSNAARRAQYKNNSVPSKKVTRKPRRTGNNVRHVRSY